MVLDRVRRAIEQVEGVSTTQELRDLKKMSGTGWLTQPGAPAEAPVVASLNLVVIFTLGKLEEAVRHRNSR